ncbi:ATP synthase B chain [Streptococcus gordonii]|uniref:ATP synthase subunit b n=1 Tax=Streptococcus gordonii TaxID=1302 RepID=A0A139NFK1_STRGN|nr:ATP synthase B chain [Streptococcus gordonii]
MHVTIGEIIGNFILIAGSFLLLVFLVKKFAWGNIVGILDQRAQKISEDIDSAEAARKKAEDLAQKREEALAGSREEAATIVETAKETAEKNKASILADTTEEVSRLKQKVNQEIAQSKADALKSIKGDVADLSIDLASKIIGKTLDKEAQSQLIDSYIDKLGDA